MTMKRIHPKVALHSQKLKREAAEQRRLALKWLSGRFPEAFDTRERVRPLKKGIRLDLLREIDASSDDCPFSRNKLSEALAMFTHRIEYLTCLKLRESRIDLQGNVVNEVTEKEALEAHGMIRAQIEKMTRINEQNEPKPAKIVKPTPRALPRIEYPNTSPSLESRVSSSACAGSGSGSSAQVVVKRKATRTISSPETIARLKAKLGLDKDKA